MQGLLTEGKVESLPNRFMMREKLGVVLKFWGQGLILLSFMNLGIILYHPFTVPVELYELDAAYSNLIQTAAVHTEFFWCRGRGKMIPLLHAWKARRQPLDHHSLRLPESAWWNTPVTQPMTFDLSWIEKCKFFCCYRNSMNSKEIFLRAWSHFTLPLISFWSWMGMYLWIPHECRVTFDFCCIRYIATLRDFDTAQILKQIIIFFLIGSSWISWLNLSHSWNLHTAKMFYF